MERVCQRDCLLPSAASRQANDARSRLCVHWCCRLMATAAADVVVVLKQRRWIIHQAKKSNLTNEDGGDKERETWKSVSATLVNDDVASTLCYIDQSNHLERERAEINVSEMYHCMADLLFNLFRFSCFAHFELATALLVWSNRHWSNRRSAVQWLFPIKSKSSFSDCIRRETFKTSFPHFWCVCWHWVIIFSIRLAT